MLPNVIDPPTPGFFEATVRFADVSRASGRPTDAATLGPSDRSTRLVRRSGVSEGPSHTNELPCSPTDLLSRQQPFDQRDSALFGYGAAKDFGHARDAAADIRIAKNA